MFRFTNKKLTLILVTIAIFVSSLVLVDVWQKYFQRQGLTESELLKASKEKIVTYEFGVDEQNNEIVSYQYITKEEVPEAMYEGLKENINKRTKNSQSFLKEVRQIDSETIEEEYVAKFYPTYTFEQVGKNWYQVETATTTPQAFVSQTRLTILDRAKEFLGQPAFAATDTTYSGSGDGYVAYTTTEGDADDNWDAVHDAVTGKSAIPTGAYMITGGGDGLNFFGSPGNFMYRAFVPFDTSALSDDVTISSATLYLRVYDTAGIINGANDGNDFLTVVQTTQASNTTLVIADYDTCGAINNPTEGIDVGSRIDFGDLALDTYFSFALNGTGLSWISKTGYTNLGIREGHDALDDDFVGDSDGIVNDVLMFTSDVTGTSDDPYLEVTYTEVTPKKIKIDNGKIKIDNGKIKID